MKLRLPDSEGAAHSYFAVMVIGGDWQQQSWLLAPALTLALFVSWVRILNGSHRIQAGSPAPRLEVHAIGELSPVV